MTPKPTAQTVTVSVEMVLVSQLTKNLDLSYGFSEGQVKKLTKIIGHYGDICPLIVVQTEDEGMYKILKGQDVYEAAKKNKLKKVQVLILKNISEFDDKLIPLTLSMLKSEIGAIAQGVIINQLIKDHGFTLEILSEHCGVSKSWLCKRQSLAVSLDKEVKDLVSEGKIAPRTAEEIAKLPPGCQARFASEVIKNSISKDRASELVKLYKDSHSDESLRQRIINDPNSVSLMDHERDTKKKKKEEKVPMTLNKSIQHAINAIENVKNQLSKAGKTTLSPLLRDVWLLGKIAGELANLASTVARTGE
jgi:ParB/RepB/Spo0J family partition protein